MTERHSDLWEHVNAPGHLICISTNGFIKKNGAAVMGRGCALQATRIYPGVPMLLGTYIRHNGNNPGLLYGEKFTLGILPVKHNWWERADLALIKRSVDWLREELGQLHLLGHHTVHVPRLGCGNGGRNWEKEVRPLMQTLPDCVVVHS